MLAECHFFVNVGNEYKISKKCNLFQAMYELDLKVTIPNTVRFVNCCYHHQSHTMKMKVESISYPETGLGLKFNLMFLRLMQVSI